MYTRFEYRRSRALLLLVTLLLFLPACRTPGESDATAFSATATAPDTRVTAPQQPTETQAATHTPAIAADTAVPSPSTEPEARDAPVYLWPTALPEPLVIVPDASFADESGFELVLSDATGGQLRARIQGGATVTFDFDDPPFGVEPVTIRGQTGYAFTTGAGWSLHWHEQGAPVSIVGGLPRDMAFALAESLTAVDQDTWQQRVGTSGTHQPETATPPAAPVAEPGGYLLYSLQAEPEGEMPHEEFWRTGLVGSDRLRLLALPPNQAFKGLAVAPDGTQFASIVEPMRAGRDDMEVPDQLIRLKLDIPVGQSDFPGMSNGSADSRLAEGKLQIWPNAFSPDGSRLAFVSTVEAATTDALLPDRTTLQVVDAAYGATPRAVTPEYAFISQPAWLDNDTLIFSPAQIPNVFTQTLQVDISATPPQPPAVLADGAFVALSPDKTRLLVLQEPLGTNLAPAQPVPYALVALTGETPEVLQEWQIPPGNFAWSPDGTMLAQTDFAGTLRLLHLDDGSTEELLQVDTPNKSIAHLDWSADSRSLIYALGGTGEAIVPRELYRLNVADATSQLIISGDSNDFTEVLVVQE